MGMAELGRALVSVLVASHRRPVWLLEALASLQAQQDPHWEAVVADDGSDPATRAALAQAAAQDPRIRPLWLPHSGNLCRVRNAAFAAAQGDLIAFLDDDDTWLPDKLTWQRRLLMEQPQAPLVCGQVRRFGDATGVWPRKLPRHFNFSRLLRGNQVAVGTVLARRAALPERDPFDESLPQVAEFALWLALARHADLACQGRVLARYRVHAQGMSRARTLESDQLEILYDRLEQAGVPASALSPGRRGIWRSRARLAPSLAAALPLWLKAWRPGSLPGRRSPA